MRMWRIARIGAVAALLGVVMACSGLTRSGGTGQGEETARHGH